MIQATYYLATRTIAATDHSKQFTLICVSSALWTILYSMTFLARISH